jgi:hypothetical protein
MRVRGSQKLLEHFAIRTTCRQHGRHCQLSASCIARLPTLLDLAGFHKDLVPFFASGRPVEQHRHPAGPSSFLSGRLQLPLAHLLPRGGIIRNFVGQPRRDHRAWVNPPPHYAHSDDERRQACDCQPFLGASSPPFHGASPRSFAFPLARVYTLLHQPTTGHPAASRRRGTWWHVRVYIAQQKKPTISRPTMIARGLFRSYSCSSSSLVRAGMPAMASRPITLKNSPTPNQFPAPRFFALAMMAQKIPHTTPTITSIRASISICLSPSRKMEQGRAPCSIRTTARR